MNEENTRIVKTGLYSKKAQEILSSVLGQLSDGWGESNPRNDRYWRFAEVSTEPDGEVVIAVSASRDKRAGVSWNRMPRWVSNGFWGLSDDAVLTQFAKWVKKTMQMELKDENASNGWRRDNVDFRTTYLSRNEPISVAEVYCVCEQLLRLQCGLSKYSPEILRSAFGNVRTPEETAAEIERRKAYDQAERRYQAERKSIDEWEESEIARIRKEAEDRRAKAFRALSEFKA